MKFLILEQKFLELLEDGKCIDAFNCLRQELASLNVNQERLATLAQVIMLKDIKQVRALTGWQGKTTFRTEIFITFEIRELVKLLESFLFPNYWIKLNN